MSGRSPRWFTGIQYPYEANFADNTWAQIIEACQKKRIPSTWHVGNQKAMTINGTDYLIDIIGFDHDEYTDGSGKAPITFQMHDCYGTMYAMNAENTNVGGWASSDMRNTHLPAIMALMPAEVQAAIRTVNKKSNTGGKSTTIETTACSLFLLAEIEVFGERTESADGEGTCYRYYATGGNRIKKVNGTAVYWFERGSGIAIGGTSAFCAVHKTGDASFYGASTLLGVSFAFCF